MAKIICPVCNEEMTHNHDCVRYDFSKLSLDLDFLGLSFEAVPYESADVSEQSFTPFVPERNSKRNAVTGKGVQIGSVPMFLRL